MTTARAESMPDSNPRYKELREKVKPQGLTLGFKSGGPGNDPLLILRNGTGAAYSTTSLDEMGRHIESVLTPAEDAPTEAEAQDPSEAITEPEPVPAPVEAAAAAPLDAVEDIDGTWVIARRDIDGSATYWMQENESYSLLIRQGVALWPNKQQAESAVREELGKLPRDHKPLKLTDEQAEMVGSPYRVIQGEVVDDQLALPAEFSEMELPELANAVKRWGRKAGALAAHADNVMSAAVEAACYAGRALNEAKARCKARGEKFMPWVAHNFDGSHDLANKYMNLAENSERVMNLDPSTSLREAIKQITAKPAPPKPDDTNPSNKAAKTAAKKAPGKTKAINEITTLIAELNTAVAKQLTKYTFTADEADIITERMVTPLWDIRLELQRLANIASTGDLNGTGDE